jgi:hypothetical protein
MINYLQEALAIKTDGLFLCVMGPSGAGKSHFIGTHPGKTLLVYGQSEAHGPASAVKSNKDIIALSWSQTKDGPVKPELYLKRLKDILDPEALKAAGIKCVALDSITNLCPDLKATPLCKQRCLSAQGKHNPFKETEALIEMVTKILNQLQVLSDVHDIDIITTMDLAITSIGTSGEIIESKPGLPTFGVGKALIQQFPDILVLGRIDGQPKFQNLSKAVSKSVDRDTEEVVKYLEYNPRLRGVEKLPELLEPSVSAILELKK